MAQGYSGYNILDNSFTIKDSPNLDAFSRLRISNPYPLFSSQFTYNLNPLLFEQLTTSNGTVTYNSTNRCATMTFTSAVNTNTAYMQSYEHIPYQPSKSQLVFVTFNMKAYTTNVLKFAGLSTGSGGNGIEFQNTGALNRFVIYSQTDAGDQIINQDSWNLDKLDGYGTSGLTLDITKSQILVIDFQALYTGRVRVGFDIDGKIIYCHEFKNSNRLLIVPYIQTANLPVRCGMIATGSAASASMDFVCCAVVSEGGTEDANLFSYAFSVSADNISVNTNSTHLLSIRPKSTFNSITTRSKLIYTDLEIYNGGGNAPLKWELCIGQVLTGATFSDVNTSYSSTEYCSGTSAGLNSTSPDLIIIDSGYLPPSNGGRGQSASISAFSRYPITLGASGSSRALGTLTLRAQTLSSNTNSVYAAIKFKELR